METIIQIFEAIPYLIAAASAICAATPSPKDDALLAKLYKLLEIAALNIGKAKL